MNTAMRAARASRDFSLSLCQSGGIVWPIKTKDAASLRGSRLRGWRVKGSSRGRAARLAQTCDRATAYSAIGALERVIRDCPRLLAALTAIASEGI